MKYSRFNMYIAGFLWAVPIIIHHEQLAVEILVIGKEGPRAQLYRSLL